MEAPDPIEGGQVPGAGPTVCHVLLTPGPWLNQNSPRLSCGCRQSSGLRAGQRDRHDGLGTVDQDQWALTPFHSCQEHIQPSCRSDSSPSGGQPSLFLPCTWEAAAFLMTGYQLHHHHLPAPPIAQTCRVSARTLPRGRGAGGAHQTPPPYTAPSRLGVHPAKSIQ